MLRNCEKIITPISSTTTNEWTQNHHLELDAPMPSPSPPANKAAAMDPLKCPRCDSSNTKFCYYNNYSLSQPRHFCKACKRYWTRGGTLRNVPVGGGCRKNKRSKRHPSSSTDALSSSSAASSQPVQTHEMDLSNPTRIHNPLFFNPIELNFPFSSFSSSTRVSATSGLDLHSQMNNPLGLGFSSGLGLQSEVMNNDFKPIQDAVNGATHNSILFGSSNLGSTSTMASFLASTLQHHGIKAPSNVPGLMQPYEDPGNPNPIDQINSSDPSSLVWNTTWFDPPNMGSSVQSLI